MYPSLKKHLVQQKVFNVTCEEIKFLKVKSWVKKLSETWVKLKKIYFSLWQVTSQLKYKLYSDRSYEHTNNPGNTVREQLTYSNSLSLFKPSWHFQGSWWASVKSIAIELCY